MKHYTPMYEDDMSCVEDAGLEQLPGNTYYLASDVDARIARMEWEHGDIQRMQREHQEKLKARIAELERELNRVTRGDVSSIVTTLGDALTRISLLERALRYYRDECTGYEPSQSVFDRMVDEAIGASRPLMVTGYTEEKS